MGKKFIKIILVVLPFILMLGALPFVNRIDPIILGLPFLHFWLFLGMLITPISTYVIYRLQKSEGSIE
jgi:Kef-type K+ transport system membrane component KefB